MSTNSENAQVLFTCAHGETAKPGRGMGGTELRKCLSEVGKGSQRLQCVRAAPSSDLMRHVNLSVLVSILLCGRYGWQFANTPFSLSFQALPGYTTSQNIDFHSQLSLQLGVVM